MGRQERAAARTHKGWPQGFRYEDFNRSETLPGPIPLRVARVLADALSAPDRLLGKINLLMPVSELKPTEEPVI